LHQPFDCKLKLEGFALALGGEAVARRQGYAGGGLQAKHPTARWLAKGMQSARWPERPNNQEFTLSYNDRICFLLATPG